MVYDLHSKRGGGIEQTPEQEYKFLRFLFDVKIIFTDKFKSRLNSENSCFYWIQIGLSFSFLIPSLLIWRSRRYKTLSLRVFPECVFLIFVYVYSVI